MVVVAVVAGALLSACGAAGTSTAPTGSTTGTSGTSGTAGTAGTAGTVEVSRRTVTSTVVLAARVEAGRDVRVTAPFDGTFTVTPRGITYTRPHGATGRLPLPAGLRVVRALATGTPVVTGMPVAEAHVRGFALVAPVDASTLYRFFTPSAGARGQITRGPGPFDCPLADPTPGVVGKRGTEPAELELTCLVPSGVRVFEGMDGALAVTTGQARDVPVVPVEAVAGTADQGEVWLIDAAGGRSRRDVELGVSDGVVIEVRGGLTEGQRVAVPGPDLTQRS